MMDMDLFQTHQPPIPMEWQAPQIPTAMGPICFNAHTNQHWLSTQVSGLAYRLSSTASAYTWQTERARFELVLAESHHFHPSVPELAIKACWAGLWRMKALTPIEQVGFSCLAQFADVPIICNGPESGESLEALSWTQGETRLTLGTQDGEALAQNKRIPPLWKESMFWPEINYHVTPVEYVDQGLILTFPGMIPGEQCEIQFVLAWSDLNTSEEQATWLAVDVDPDKLIRAIRELNH
jgi:hypothetical protein